MIETPPLQHIGAGTYSVLPTGRLRIENGLVEQEAEVIVHRKSNIRCNINGDEIAQDFNQGVYHLWFSVPVEFIRKIRSGDVRLPME